jgi:hypothetical protein
MRNSNFHWEKTAVLYCKKEVALTSKFKRKLNRNKRDITRFAIALLFKCYVIWRCYLDPLLAIRVSITPHFSDYKLGWKSKTKFNVQNEYGPSGPALADLHTQQSVSLSSLSYTALSALTFLTDFAVHCVMCTWRNTRQMSHVPSSHCVFCDAPYFEPRPLLRKRLYVHGKWPTWRTILFFVFIPFLYMFRATSCSSSGESVVSIQHLVCVTLCRWPFRVRVEK